MKWISARGIVRAIRDMNVRVGAPSLTAQTVPAAKNETFMTEGYVTDGDTVGGNSKWYETTDGDFIWSGNVEFIKEPKQNLQILHAPLKKLICTQRFGLRPDVYKKYGCPKGHNGIDFRTWVGKDPSHWKQPVYAVLDGIVSEAAFDPKFKGNYVRIKHYNDYESVYLHLDSLKVSKGDEVTAGEQIGVSGNTGGASEAPHLHFGYRPQKCNVSDGYMGYIDPTGLFVDDIAFV